MCRFPVGTVIACALAQVVIANYLANGTTSETSARNKVLHKNARVRILLSSLLGSYRKFGTHEFFGSKVIACAVA